MNHSDQRGSITFSALVIAVLFLSLALAVVPLVRGSTNSRIQEDLHKIEMENAFLEILDVTMEAISEDMTPDSDSAQDQVWSVIEGQSSDQIEVTLEDLSSRIDPNSAQPQYLASQAFSFLLQPGINEQVIIDFREFQGYSINLAEHYQTIFTQEAIDSYLSPYAYVNINIAFPEAILDLVEQRSGDAAFATFVKELVEEKYRDQERFTETEWLSFLRLRQGQDSESSLFPILSTLPVWNVHQVPERLLGALAAYPFLELDPLGPSFVDTILTLRNQGTIDPEYLDQLIDSSTEDATQALIIKSFLGTKTWFYRFIAAERGQEGRALEAIIGVLPLEPGEFHVFLVNHQFSGISDTMRSP